MGNKMSCLCRRGEEDNTEEGIYMEVLNPGEVREENSQVSDSAHYEEVIEDPQPLYDVPYDHNPPETIRLRIVAEHYHSLRVERRVYYNNTILINPNVDIETTPCLFHISEFNNRRERIADSTYINDLTSNTIKKRILYRKNPEEDTWTVTEISDDDPNVRNIIQFRPMRSAFVWAFTTHKRQGSKVKKYLFLSQKPVTVIVPPRIKESLRSVVHLTSYNLHMVKIYDLIIVRATYRRSPDEYYIQWKGPDMDVPAYVCYTDQRHAGPF